MIRRFHYRDSGVQYLVGGFGGLFVLVVSPVFLAGRGQADLSSQLFGACLIVVVSAIIVPSVIHVVNYEIVVDLEGFSIYEIGFYRKKKREYSFSEIVRIEETPDEDCKRYKIVMADAECIHFTSAISRSRDLIDILSEVCRKKKIEA